jgi:hypothetical protein
VTLGFVCQCGKDINLLSSGREFGRVLNSTAVNKKKESLSVLISCYKIELGNIELSIGRNKTNMKNLRFSTAVAWCR